jgi:hypothetical protein
MVIKRMPLDEEEEEEEEEEAKRGVYEHADVGP